MGPGSLRGEEIGKEQQAAVVIDGSDERPFLLGIQRPQVCGDVMLDQSTDRAGENLAVLGFVLHAGLLAAQGLGPINDGVHRHCDALLAQAVA